MSAQNNFISLSEVKKHNRDTNAWIVIHDEVYDVTKYIDEHPGGSDPLLGEAGKDGTQAFEDIGHSDDAREILKKFKIGVLRPEDRNLDNTPGRWWLWLLLTAGVVAGGAFVYKKYGG